MFGVIGWTFAEVRQCWLCESWFFGCRVYTACKPQGKKEGQSLKINARSHWVYFPVMPSVFPPIMMLVAQSCQTPCDLMDCSSPGSFVHGILQERILGWGCHSLLQGIFPTQGSNPGFLHCRWILYHLSYQGSPTNPNQHWQQIQSVDFYFVGSSWGDQACLLSPGYGGDLLIGTNSPERRQKNRLGG